MRLRIATTEFETVEATETRTAVELPVFSLLQRRPFRFDANLISRIMWKNIMIFSVYELFICCYLLFGINTIFPEIEAKSELHYTLIFM